MGKSGLFKKCVSVLFIIFRLTLGLVFLYSGWLKWKYPYLFLADIYKYEMVSIQLGLLTAAVLPVLEMGLGLALLTNMVVRRALLVSSCLFVVFTVLQYSAIARGLQINCGCFSSSSSGDSSLVSYSSLLRAIVLLLISIATFFYYWKSDEALEKCPCGKS
jgi:putative oxidoreductase